MKCSNRDLYSASLSSSYTLLDGNQNINITTAAFYEACVANGYIVAYAGGYGNKIPLEHFEKQVKDAVDWEKTHKFHMGRNFFFDDAVKDCVIAPAFPFVLSVDEDSDTYAAAAAVESKLK